MKRFLIVIICFFEFIAQARDVSPEVALALIKLHQSHIDDAVKAAEQITDMKLRFIILKGLMAGTEANLDAAKALNAAGNAKLLEQIELLKKILPDESAKKRNSDLSPQK